MNQADTNKFWLGLTKEFNFASKWLEITTIWSDVPCPVDEAIYYHIYTCVCIPTHTHNTKSHIIV